MIAVLKLKVAIEKELGSYFSTEAHSEGSLIRYINSAVRDICTQKNFDFNKYIKTYTVSTPWVPVQIDYNIETYFIKKWSSDVAFYDFEHYYKNWKQWVCIYWDKLISETPWDYTIYFRGYPVTLTKLEWNLDIPQHFFDLIVVKAVYFWFADIRAYEQATIKDSIYKGMIYNMATRTTNKNPLVKKRLNNNNNKVW